MWLQSIFKKNKTKEPPSLPHFGKRLLANYLTSIYSEDQVRNEIFFLAHHADIAPNKVRELLEPTKERVKAGCNHCTLLKYLVDTWKLSNSQATHVAAYVLKIYKGNSI